MYNIIRNESPFQVRYRIQDAWGWCTEMNQRDGMEREVGGRFKREDTNIDLWLSQHATGDQWRNNSRKNEGMKPKQKQYPAGDVAGDRSTG